MQIWLEAFLTATSHNVETDGLARISTHIVRPLPKSLLWDKRFEDWAHSIKNLRLITHVKRDLSKEEMLGDVSGMRILHDFV